ADRARPAAARVGARRRGPRSDQPAPRRLRRALRLTSPGATSSSRAWRCDPVRLHVHLQETYHTRILADVAAIFGLPVRAGPTGRALMRGLYRLGALHLAAQMLEIVRLFGRPGLRWQFREPFRLGHMVAESPERAFAAGQL